jgi:hypothetical protein
MSALPVLESLEKIPFPPSPATTAPYHPPTWLASGPADLNNDPILFFHDEILAFARWVSPNKAEVAWRNQIVERLSRCVRAVWPSANVRLPDIYHLCFLIIIFVLLRYFSRFSLVSKLSISHFSAPFCQECLPSCLLNQIQVYGSTESGLSVPQRFVSFCELTSLLFCFLPFLSATFLSLASHYIWASTLERQRSC